MASPSTGSAAAATTTTTTTTGDSGSLKLESVPIVDLRLLSQSELYSLSVFSSLAFDPRRCDDVVIPKIDRSVFNESAGSRKQTYSRLRLAPPSSSSLPLRRRTPHLRHNATTVSNISNNYSDPENAENALIINLLKQLFCPDTNHDELVPVKIDYSHSLLPTKLSSLPLNASNVGHASHKRKRGRPPKNKLLENERESAAMEVSGVKENVEGIRIMDEIVVRKNTEDMDREFTNRDGVAVDFIALGMVEHPYWEEIRRRTGGLRSEEELLGFLNILDGQWGSRRKKKRIVDASIFGSALPIGWKLLLSVRKKNGHVWLYCRRYISPSGRQFVSCKDVSSYLLSLHCAQFTSPTQHKEIAIDTDKLIPVSIADLSVQDDIRKENLVFHTSSPTFASTSGNHEMQIIVNAGELPVDGVRELLHCSKCNMTFSEKDELLKHQSSLHRKNRNKNGVRITDGVIIKEGKYECQFCHKLFSERHRYNGHIGAHVRYQAKIAGESEAVGKAEFVDPSSFGEVPVLDNMTKGSLGSERSNVAEICYAASNNGPNLCSPCNKDIVPAGYSQKANGNMRGVDEPTDIVTATSPRSVVEVLVSSNENNSLREASDYVRVTGSAAEIIDDGSSLQERSGRCSPFQFHDETYGLMNSTIENSVSAENPKPDMISESSLFNSRDNVEACDIVVKNGLTCLTKNELKRNAENFAVNELKFDFFGSHGGQDKDIAVSVKQLSNYEDLSCENTSISHNPSTSVSMVSKLNEDSNISMLAPSDGNVRVEANVPCLIGKFTVDETFSFGTCETNISEADNDTVSRHEEMQFGISLVIPSWNEQETVSKKYDTEVSTCVATNPGEQNATKSMLVNLSGHESNCGAQNNNDGICREKIEVPEFDCTQNFGNGELSDPFSSSHTALNSNSMTRTEQCINLEVCSGFTSATDKLLFSEDNIMRAFSSELEEHKQEPFESILLGQSGVSEVSDEEYTVNKIYATPANQSKLNDIENTGKHELSLSFGNLKRELLTDSNMVEQERYLGKSVDIQSAVQKIHGLLTQVSTPNSNIAGDLKQGKSFGIGFLDSSFNNRTREIGSSFNMAHSEMDWNGPRGDKIGTPGLNFMVELGNSSTQSGEFVKDDGSRRTGHSNVFQGCFDAVSSPQVQSSRCFHTFNLTSDKGEEGSFGVKSYDIHSDILRPGRTEPVEYSFMGELSLNSLPGESKIFSYNLDLEQGLDPSFWLGKDDLMPNIDDSHQVTSVCVWCRNLFYHEPVQTGIQTDAIGSMCPSCSTRIPGQFNVL